MKSGDVVERSHAGNSAGNLQQPRANDVNCGRRKFAETPVSAGFLRFPRASRDEGYRFELSGYFEGPLELERPIAFASHISRRREGQAMLAHLQAAPQGFLSLADEIAGMAPLLWRNTFHGAGHGTWQVVLEKRSLEIVKDRALRRVGWTFGAEYEIKTSITVPVGGVD